MPTVSSASKPRLIATAAATAALSVTAIVAAPGTPHASAAPSCTDVVVIGARGSGEPKNIQGALTNFGKSLSYVAQKIGKATEAEGDSWSWSGIDYPAKGTETMIPKLTATTAEMVIRVNRYLGSVNEGRDKIVAEVHRYQQDCPDSDLVLIGYSQGAIAVHQAELRLKETGGEDGLDQIAGTLLLADGDRIRNSSAALAGTAGASGQGIRHALKLARSKDVPDGENTVNVCNRHDPVCDTSLPSRITPGKFRGLIKIHTTYFDDGQANSALTDGITKLTDDILGYGD